MADRLNGAAASPAAGERPYAGVRILDMTHTLGSYAGRLFADLGAEVIRVEPPGGLPDRRRMTSGTLSEARFAFLNASKKSVEIDLNSDGGRAQFARLAREARIGFLERGDYNPSLELALSVAAVFNVPIELLFSFKPFPSVAETLLGQGDSL